MKELTGHHDDGFRRLQKASEKCFRPGSRLTAVREVILASGGKKYNNARNAFYHDKGRNIL